MSGPYMGGAAPASATPNDAPVLRAGSVDDTTTNPVSQTLAHDSETIARFARWLDHAKHGGCAEVRILNSPAHTDSSYVGPGTHAGYFTEPARIALQLTPWDGGHPDCGIYISANPLNPDLLARADHRVRRAQRGGCGSADDVVRLVHLVLDFDPTRAAGIPATDAELAAALAARDRARERLAVLGVHGATATSGNGGYLILPTIGYANTPENRKAWGDLLDGFASVFSYEGVKLDEALKDPSRVIRLLGTVNSKGDGTEDRPWRLSTFDDPGVIEPVDLLGRASEILAALGAASRTTVPVAATSTCSTTTARKAADPSDTRPGTDFNARTTWAELLEADGWTRTTTGDTQWTRPGKDPSAGLSATTDYMGSDLLYVFTSSVPELQANRSYDRFGYFAAMHHGGDHRAAAAAVKRDDVVEDRPVIVVGNDIAVMVEAAERALAADPNVYAQDGRIVIVEAGQVVPLTTARLMELLSSRARWREKGKDGQRDTLPQRQAVEALHTPRVRRHLRELRRVALAPSLRPDGSVLSAPGYDSASATLYAPALDYPRVEDRPTEGAAREALAVLLDPLVDFPFQENSDRSTALALMLTIAGRAAINGPTPYFGVTSSTPGTGKGLLARVCVSAMTGAEPRIVAPARTDEEEGKRMLSWGREGRPVMVDNIATPWGNETLALAATARHYTGRVLGVSQTSTVDVPIIVATGNNLAYTGDLHRRVVPIRLACNMERPEERSGFHHGADDALIEYVTAKHPRLLSAALTVLRWYLTSGRTPTLPAFGSYGAWSALVRGALVSLGLADPDTGRQSISALADADRDHHATLLRVWRARLGAGDVTLADVIRSAERNEDLRDVLEALQRRPGKLDSRLLGHRLAAMRDRIIDGFALVVTPKRARGKVWRVVSVGGESPNIDDSIAEQAI